MTTGLRERKKEQVRAQLTRSAFRLISERGFDRATVAAISADAGVSPATFFRYFATKEDVVFGNAPSRLETVRRALRDRSAGEPPMRGLREAFIALAEELERDPETPMRVAVLLNHRSLIARLDETMGIWTAAIAQELAADGHPMPDATVAASVGVALFRAGLTLWNQGEGVLPELVARGFDTLERSFVPR